MFEIANNVRQSDQKIDFSHAGVNASDASRSRRLPLRRHEMREPQARDAMGLAGGGPLLPHRPPAGRNGIEVPFTGAESGGSDPATPLGGRSRGHPARVTSEDASEAPAVEVKEHAGSFRRQPSNQGNQGRSVTGIPNRDRLTEQLDAEPRVPAARKSTDRPGFSGASPSAASLPPLTTTADRRTPWPPSQPSNVWAHSSVTTSRSSGQQFSLLCRGTRHRQHSYPLIHPM